ncbi:SDR family NAD(P)-dependent oxidoreductase [Rhodococcus hoagii]|nr:SDR family NAD(P)-dependent oxidoreductase [Prescottella equi]
MDVLVANAGIGSWRRWARSPRSSSTPCSPPRQGLAVTVQKALPLLSAGASIILTGSTAASRPEPYLHVYGATKAAFVTWFAVRPRRRERRYRINMLSPGGTPRRV